MPAPRLKVLIIGAGIAGPCLAYWLSRTRLDVSITIVERSPDPRPTGQPIDIRGAAVEILRKMHLLEAVRANHTTEEGTVFVDTAGEPFARFEGSDGDLTAEYEILRADLLQLFLNATKDSSNVRYIYGSSVDSLQQSEKSVDVTFDGASKETFDLVVAADGVGSKTRPMILSGQSVKDCYKPLGHYIAFFTIPRESHDSKLWQWYSEPKGLCMMLRPHRNDSTIGVYLCLTTPSRGQRDPTVEKALGQGIEAEKSMLKELFGGLGWQSKRILDGMTSSDDFYMSRMALIRLDKWTNRRALVIGDAAFATFGVGTSLAIEAAYVLAGELSKIQSGEDVPGALENYEKVFRTMYSKVEKIPPFFPQLIAPQSSWGLWLRDLIIRLASWTKIYRLLPSDYEGSWVPPSYDWKD